MIFLKADSSSVDLNASAAQAIFTLLGVNNPPDVHEFLENPDEDPDFYAFFFDVLVDNDIPCVIDIDWKWDPADIFWQFNLAMPEDKLVYLATDFDTTQQIYKISYQYKDKTEHIEVAYDRPGDLVTALLQYLPGKDIVALDFGEDRYSWLIVPADFDIEAFCNTTGLTTDTPTEEKTEPIPENFTEGHRQSQKIFFTPRIIYVEQSGTGYKMSNQFWSGRVLPGQTIREGIASELQQEMRYTDRFDYVYDKYIDTRKDRKGRDIKRYQVTVYLYDRTFQSRMAGGADIRLTKITGQKFQHPDSK